MSGTLLTRDTFNCFITETSLSNVVLLNDKEYNEYSYKKKKEIKNDRISHIKHMLTIILYGLTVENWTRVCVILKRKMSSKLFDKLSKLTSLDKSLIDIEKSNKNYMDKETIKKYSVIFPDLKKCLKSNNLDICPLYKFYLTMNNRFVDSSLQSILNRDEYCVTIRNFLKWLKTGVFEELTFKEEIKEKEPPKEIKEEMDETKEAKEETEEAKEKEMVKEIQEVKESEETNEKEMDKQIEREMEEEIEKEKRVIKEREQTLDFMVKNTNEIYNKLKKLNEDLCEQYCNKWFVTKEKCKLKCLDISQFIYSISPISPHEYKPLLKSLDYLKKGTFTKDNLPIDEILDTWTLFRDLQELRIDKFQYADIVKQIKKQTKKHGGNHIKRTRKKKHGRRKSIRNIRHNRRRTRKT